MSNASTARTFLWSNAAFSMASGLALLLVPDPISQHIWSEPADWQVTLFRLLGIGLIIFSLDIGFITRTRYLTAAQVNQFVIADIAWVVASVAIIVFANRYFLVSGIWVIALVALIVALFAVGQFTGARKITQPLANVSFSHDGDTLLSVVNRRVQATPDRVWRVMTDHERYADVASNISKVEVTSGDALGMQRRCYGTKNESWSETCDHYQAGRSYGFKVHTEAADYPYPFALVRGRWSVEALNDTTQFRIEIGVKPKGNWIMRKLFPMIAKNQFRPILIDLAEAWAARMEQQD